jgi:EAL and modified HD-GYP domain-containing signal transduction protein
MSIAYRVLRYVNSAGFGSRKQIDSIRQAIVYMGIDLVRKWTSVWALAGLGRDKPLELVVGSVIRGLCCELLAPKLQMPNRTQELFLLGTFSMIDAIMDRPMEDVLSNIALPPDVLNALAPGDGPLRGVLDVTVAFERGDWSACAARAADLGVAEQDIAAAYHEASECATKVFTAA